jgi:hypothetical protein
MNITDDQHFTTDRPLLQLDPLFVVSASAVDSGINKQFQFHVSPVLLEKFSPISSTNKTDRHDITEILLKVVLNTITLTQLDQFFVQINLVDSLSYFNQTHWKDFILFIG